MGSDEIHPGALRELDEEVAKPLATVFEKLWQFPMAIPTDWKRRNRTSIYFWEGKLGRQLAG